MSERPEPSGEPGEQPADEAAETVGEPSDASVQVIDLVPDEMTLARAQLDAGQPGLAEGTVRRRLAWLESEGVGLTDESDALRVLLAEALWRQQRPIAARQALDAVRSSSPQRRLPIAMVVEADALAAAGEADRAAGQMERAIDADEAKYVQSLVEFDQWTAEALASQRKVRLGATGSGVSNSLGER